MDHPNTIDFGVAEFRAIEFFHGYGGNSLGLHRVIKNLRVIAACEIEAYACANVVAKAEGHAMDAFPCWTDVKTFPCEQFRGLVDLLIASYPCQGFSSAGQRKGTEDPRFLWPFVLRAIVVIQPAFVFLENVEGHVSLGLRQVLTDLALCGYRVESRRKEPTWGVFSAAECGAPQQRKRVFVLAARNGVAQGNPTSRKVGRKSVGTEKAVAVPCGGSDAGELADSEHSAGRTEQEQQRAQYSEIVSGGNQLANPENSNGRLLLQQRESREAGAEPERASEGLVNTEEFGCERQWDARARRTGLASASPNGVGLADPSGERLQGNECDGRTEQERRQEPDGSVSELRPLFWPTFVARPGEHQHGWEPPRVIETQRGLGGGVDGRAANVDRLRMLGNGVYPATAATAFRTLYARLTK